MRLDLLFRLLMMGNAANNVLRLIYYFVYLAVFTEKLVCLLVREFTLILPINMLKNKKKNGENQVFFLYTISFFFTCTLNLRRWVVTSQIIVALS